MLGEPRSPASCEGGWEASVVPLTLVNLHLLIDKDLTVSLWSREILTIRSFSNWVEICFLVDIQNTTNPSSIWQSFKHLKTAYCLLLVLYSLWAEKKCNESDVYGTVSYFWALREPCAGLQVTAEMFFWLEGKRYDFDFMRFLFYLFILKDIIQQREVKQGKQQTEGEGETGSLQCRA